MAFQLIGRLLLLLLLSTHAPVSATATAFLSASVSTSYILPFFVDLLCSVLTILLNLP